MANKKGSSRTVRIIGGIWRGHKLPLVVHNDLRPSSDRLRETLFNWLQPLIKGRRCLDLFAGSGALGLEALSRGATSCVFVEQHLESARQIQNKINDLGTESAAIVQHSNATQWLGKATGCFDMVFLDPPFKEASIQPYIELLENNNLLASNALLYWERAKDNLLETSPSWQYYKEACYGNVRAELKKRQVAPIPPPKNNPIN